MPLPGKAGFCFFIDLKGKGLAYSCKTWKSVQLGDYGLIRGIINCGYPSYIIRAGGEHLVNSI